MPGHSFERNQDNSNRHNNTNQQNNNWGKARLPKAEKYDTDGDQAKKEYILTLSLKDETKFNVVLGSNTLTPKDIDPYRNDVKEAIIPDGIVKVEEWTFKDCKELKKLVIPQSVKIFSRTALRGCINFEEAWIPMESDVIVYLPSCDCKAVFYPKDESKELRDSIGY